MWSKKLRCLWSDRVEHAAADLAWSITDTNLVLCALKDQAVLWNLHCHIASMNEGLGCIDCCTHTEYLLIYFHTCLTAPLCCCCCIWHSAVPAHPTVMLSANRRLASPGSRVHAVLAHRRPSPMCVECGFSSFTVDHPFSDRMSSTPEWDKQLQWNTRNGLLRRRCRLLSAVNGWQSLDGSVDNSPMFVSLCMWSVRLVMSECRSLRGSAE